MPLFKDQVALESCPAKTAESVSYGATFAVLGWLVLSNYSGMGYAGTDGETVASAEADGKALAEAPTHLDSASLVSSIRNSATEGQFAIVQRPAASDIAEAVNLKSSPDTLSYIPMVDPAAWHANLQPQHQTDYHSRANEFSATAWREASPDEAELARAYAPSLQLPTPLADSEAYRYSALDSERQVSIADDATTIHAITVTGSEGERLVARPDNIQRPQLPRPYRAQEIQHNIVLPPRIQALRP